MTKVFLDTNVLFKLFRAHIKYGTLTTSKLLRVRDRYHFVISKYVLVELVRNITVKSQLTLEDCTEKLEKFLLELQIQIYQGILVPGQQYSNLVFDYNDAQIIQDCHLSDCNILLTENIDDFDVIAIENQLGIEVSSYLM